MSPHLSSADAARIDQLVAVFTRIGEERMKDLGLYNAALKVEAVGFRRWRDEQGQAWLAGILVTPWFMNFMLLPDSDRQLDGTGVGTKRRMDMPRGEIVFTIGEVEDIGLYAASSLFSPMRDFADHAGASTRAWAAVEQFFTAVTE